MIIPLSEFEQIIDSTILKRGYNYFNTGAVVDFENPSPGKYSATVLGTEEYTVNLNLKNNTIVDYFCDCPYDYGPVCKHVAAAIFYLHQDLYTMDITPEKQPQKKRVKSDAQQIKELLKVISHNELKQFIQEKSINDRKFKNTFLSEFAHLNAEQTKASYQKQIKGILNSAKGRDGWISWSNMKYVVNTAQPLLTNAQNYFESNEFQSVFDLSTALLEEFIDAFQFADDSNGDLGYYVESAMELISTLTQENLPEPLKKEFFEYCIKTYKSGRFSGWDWHLEMLGLASNLAENENQANSILACLDTSTLSKYEKERTELFKLELIKKFRNESEVEAYIEKHIANTSIRKEEITKAYKSKNYNRAISLCKDGIDHDKKERPGLVNQWYVWLLKIAQAQKDREKTIEYAHYLFKHSHTPSNEYYQLLKATVHKDQWHPFLEKLIKEITPKNSRWTYTEHLRKIYIDEQWWDRLFLMLKQNRSLDNIHLNEAYLSKDYNKELLEFYSESILNYVENYIGRNHYQTACRYIRRMKKLGGLNEVNTLVETLKEKYPQRRALMDELSKI
ncbi:MAG: SWIM zinc finger family protein [Xanthomarina gelatinilytica]|uniref:SWIM zinc finger family protein n=1 Tax=Xanthomarina gelatinilytica TaxID=1137281 RepID=UPI003A8739FB